MSKCGNCKATLGCSCKKRTASDGKSCCANCISNYEKTVKKNNLVSGTNTTQNRPGVILNATAIQKK